MHPSPENSFLELALPLLLSKVEQLVKRLQTLGLLIVVIESFAEGVQIAATPVEITVVSLFEEVRDTLENVHQVLGPSVAHQTSDNVPGFDGSVVHDKLVLDFVVGPDSDVNSPLHEAEGVVNLV